MKIKIKIVVLFSWIVIQFRGAISQPADHLRANLIDTFNGTATNHQTMLSDRSKNASQILTKCLCVPYYRCDPGHWEQSEHDRCTRFMYVCCYGSEAVEYAINHELE